MGWRSFPACSRATEATMAIRYFALAYGILFLLGGIAGFVPGLVTGSGPVTDAPAAEAETAGHLFGLFPVNPLHNVVHIVFGRSEEHTSELQSLMRISYAVFCLKKKMIKNKPTK